MKKILFLLSALMLLLSFKGVSEAYSGFDYTLPTEESAAKSSLREVMAILQSKISVLPKDSTLYRSISNALVGAKKVLNDKNSTEADFINEKAKLEKFFESNGGVANFYFGSEFMPFEGKEVRRQKIVYTEELLRKMVQLIGVDGTNLSDRIVMTVDPGLKLGEEPKKDFFVTYSDPLGGNQTMLFFKEKDMTKPVIQTPGALDIKDGTVLTMDLLIEKGVKAYDTKDGDLTSKIRAIIDGMELPYKVTKGNYKLSLVVSDENGNETVEYVDIHVYEDFNNSELSLLLFNDKNGKEAYSSSIVDEKAVPQIVIGKSELSKALPKFAQVLYKNTGELMTKKDSKGKEWVVDIEWRLDGTVVSDLSSYTSGKKLVAIVKSKVETATDPKISFEFIEVEVGVVLH